MRINSYVITYYNSYFYGSREYYNAKQTSFFYIPWNKIHILIVPQNKKFHLDVPRNVPRNKFGKLETNTPLTKTLKTTFLSPLFIQLS